MKYYLVLACTLFFTSCTKEIKPCTVNSFIGHWKVIEDVNCAVSHSDTLKITQVANLNRIQLAFNFDTLEYTIVDCRAGHGDTRLGVVTTSSIDIENDELMFEYKSLLFILPLFCNMKCRKIE